MFDHHGSNTKNVWPEVTKYSNLNQLCISFFKSVPIHSVLCLFWARPWNCPWPNTQPTVLYLVTWSNPIRSWMVPYTHDSVTFYKFCQKFRKKTNVSSTWFLLIHHGWLDSWTINELTHLHVNVGQCRITQLAWLELHIESHTFPFGMKIISVSILQKGRLRCF